MPIFLVGFFTALGEFLVKLFGKKGAKLAFFTVYCTLLITVLVGIKEFVLSHVDTSAFMTPTICWFLNEVNAFGLLSAYFAFISANWLKAKVVQFWTSGN